MACEHDENASIATEKARLTNLERREPLRVAGMPVQLEVDATETCEQLKLNALGEAVGLVHARTGHRPESLALYLGAPCRCIAYLGEDGGSRSYVMFLGDQMLVKTAVVQTEKQTGVKGGYGSAERGVADQQYDAQRRHVLSPARLIMGKDAYQGAKLHAKAVAVIVHELGHLFHEANDSEKYWALKTQKNVEGASNDRPPADVAIQVSQYATKSKLEFVAEVFTGLIYGKHYSPAVMSRYAEYGGLAMTG